MTDAIAFDVDFTSTPVPQVDVDAILEGAVVPFEFMDNIRELIGLESLFFRTLAVAYLARINGQAGSNARKWLQTFDEEQRQDLRREWGYHADDAAEQRVTRFDYPVAWKLTIGELEAIRDLVAAAWGDTEYMDDSLAALLSHW